MSDIERAVQEWQTSITPFPIGGNVLFMIYFKHRQHPFKFFHRYFKTLNEARQEEKILEHDLEALRNDKFMEKYRIGYDLRGSIL